ILIDCNFDIDEIEEIIRFVNKPIAAYFVTHTHIDHINNLHIIESLGIPIYVPTPEDKYPCNFELIFKFSGANELNASQQMKQLAFEILDYRDLKSVVPFTPGKSFTYDQIIIETIALPGHSPGHCGFLIYDKNTSTPKILFASDIGLDSFGAWYGFKNCSLKDYRISLNIIKDLYTSGDCILTSSHNKPLFKKDISVFDKIINRMNKTESRIIEKLNYENSISLKDITFTGVYYRLLNVNKLDKMYKQLYYFWEYFILKHHLHDLQERGIVKKVADDSWVLKGK
ncbi:MAG: MBL fold metallo-hydrolase, partial [Calditrichia bacterium]|nr:MBL fold metallo-hydrolase [Calditrichia bacterium]